VIPTVEWPRRSLTQASGGRRVVTEIVKADSSEPLIAHNLAEGHSPLLRVERWNCPASRDRYRLIMPLEFA
jgi:hypothetical protein